MEVTDDKHTLVREWKLQMTSTLPREGVEVTDDKHTLVREWKLQMTSTLSGEKVKYRGREEHGKAGEVQISTLS